MDRQVRRTFPNIEQELDLWTGTLHSRFTLGADQISVRTAVHPDLDLLAVEITSSPIPKRQPASPRVLFSFPYGSAEMKAGDWSGKGNHESKIVANRPGSVRLHRRLDTDEYHVRVDWDGEASFAGLGDHTFVLEPGISQPRLSFVVAFSPRSIAGALPPAAATFEAAANHWRGFWSDGGAIDFSASSDPRALELERRVVLSQYLTAIQCAGSIPPQETGLTVNSWYGKFHLEMHWWHAAHFALWNRLSLFEKSLGYYGNILQRAEAAAQRQGYTGARWPKMTAANGDDSPSPVGPFLIWQQPHPI